ncbi:hypothetical protein F5882DRAFT_460203 [Hyaloscypha sp. PMI_1271]|nr:hypothetical protein F5882DRAFT_460203 [Hyaloscypha sp. PMI_1271]
MAILWSDAEKKTLRQLRRAGYTWDQIATQIPGRNPNTCRQHYDTIKGSMVEDSEEEPEILQRCSLWSDKEEEKLEELLETSSSWAPLLRGLHPRSPKSIKTKVSKLANPGARKNSPAWSESALRLLQTLVEEGYKWDQIYKGLPGKTIVACKAKFFIINLPNFRLRHRDEKEDSPSQDASDSISICSDTIDVEDARGTELLVDTTLRAAALSSSNTAVSPRNDIRMSTKPTGDSLGLTRKRAHEDYPEGARKRVSSRNLEEEQEQREAPCELRTNTAQIQTLRTEVEDSKLQMRSLAAEISSKGADFGTLRQEVEDSKLQMRSLAAEISSKGADFGTLRQEVEDSKLQMRSLAAEISSKGADFGTLRQEVEDSKLQMRSLAAEISSKGADFGTLRQEIEELKKLRENSPVTEADQARLEQEAEYYRVKLTSAESWHVVEMYLLYFARKFRIKGVFDKGGGEFLILFKDVYECEMALLLSDKTKLFEQDKGPFRLEFVEDGTDYDDDSTL